MVNNYGQILNNLRKSSKLTLQEVSDKSGISVCSLCLYENSKVEPRILTIKKLAGIYNISYEKLYTILQKGE